MPSYMQTVPVGSLDQSPQNFKAQPPVPPMPTLNASSVEETTDTPRNEPGGSPRGAETPGAPPSDTHKATARI